jgi:hypothetical protein
MNIYETSTIQTRRFPAMLRHRYIMCFADFLTDKL